MWGHWESAVTPMPNDPQAGLREPPATADPTPADGPDLSVVEQPLTLYRRRNRSYTRFEDGDAEYLYGNPVIGLHATRHGAIGAAALDGAAGSADARGRDPEQRAGDIREKMGFVYVYEKVHTI